MSKLRLSFLGPPLVERDGTPVTITRRKVLALLAYLAVSGRAHGREELTDLLYPRNDRDHAMADFRTVLSILRRAIGPESLLIDGERVGLRLEDGMWVDVREVRALLARAAPAEKSGDAATAERLLAEATGLIRGEFLAGLSLSDSARFDEWEEQEREGLRGEEAGALERLAGILDARGACGDAVAATRRRLSLDPLDERTVRDLMRLHAREGNRTAALRQYDRLVALLAKEMGGRPEAETTALRERIASGRFGLDARAAVSGASAAATATNLRHPLTALIGRQRELATVTRVLSRGETRLVTLTGAGGMGKTRLALEAAWKLADRFEHGAWFVDLAPVTKPAGVLTTIAAALGVQEERGHPVSRSRPRRPLEVQLGDYLRTRNVLLVLDTFERLLGATGVVSELLGGCPGLAVLVTSRQALNLRGERVIEVPPLGLAEAGRSVAGASRCDAVRLFAERSAAVVPGFTLGAATAPVALDICRMLDGMPLAIELAAAKLKTIAPAALLERLAHRLQVLADGPGDLPARQRTLRGEIDWSWELLDERGRCLFACLSVFPGGATEASAAAVCVPPGGWGPGGAAAALESLAESSLVQRRPSAGGVRYCLLDTIREYAGERLEQGGDAPRVRDRALDWLVGLAERSEVRLYGPDQDRAFAEIEGEYTNLSAALRMLKEREDGKRLVRLAGALGWFWYRRALFTEGRSWLEQGIALAEEDTNPGHRARAHHALALICRCTGRAWVANCDVRAHASEAIRLWRESGDRRGLALSLALLGSDDLREPWWTGKTYQLSENGTRIVDEALAEARGTGDAWATAMCLRFAFWWADRSDLTIDIFGAAKDEAIDLARSTGDPYLLGQVFNGLGTMLTRAKRHADALPWLEESLRVARLLDDKWSILGTLYMLGSCFFDDGRRDEARRRFTEGLRLAVSIGGTAYLSWYFGGFDFIARTEGRPRRAAKLMGVAIRCSDPDETFESISPGKHHGPDFGMDLKLLEAEWRAGQAMTLEEAVAYALSDAD